LQGFERGAGTPWITPLIKIYKEKREREKQGEREKGRLGLDINAYKILRISRDV
jgi:hypothetical protein